MVRFDPTARPTLLSAVRELEGYLNAITGKQSSLSSSSSSCVNEVGDFQRADKHVQAKVLLLGSPAAGKSCLFAAMKSERFRRTDPTIGIDFADVTAHNVSMQTWDVGGQERDMLPSFWRSTAVLVLVYDVTDLNSLQACRDLCTTFDLTKLPASLVVVATKTDLVPANQDFTSDGMAFAKNINARGFARVSSKSGVGIDKFVQLVAFCCCKSRLATCEDDDVVLLETRPTKQSCCFK